MTHPDDAPRNGSNSWPRLLGEDTLGDVAERVIAAAASRAVVPGWATVELDRAAEELAELGVPAEPISDQHDPHLGARTRSLSAAGVVAAVLLEASTEGPLAAALARHGEGFAALYLLADSGAPERLRRAGIVLSSPRRGPLGPQRLVRAGPASGPFMLLVSGD